MTSAIPLKQGEVEEDFEAMAALATHLAPNLDIDLDMEVQPNKRQRPVETSRPVVCVAALRTAVFKSDAERTRAHYHRGACCPSAAAR